MNGLLRHTERGLYCAPGDFYIDPARQVDKALITHGHADHARRGMGHYLCTETCAPVLRHRHGGINVATMAYGERRDIGGVRVSFHPAGHVPGSAQIRVEHKGEVWVASGDYKTEDDGLSERFEPVRCHSFITECTFGLPVFRWQPQAMVAAEIRAWWARNRAEGRVSIIGAYSLGKAQRLLSMFGGGGAPVLTHPVIEATNKVLRAQGIALPQTVEITPETDVSAYPGALVIAPPTMFGSDWAARFGPVSTASASGWMRLRSWRRRRAGDRAFVMSDHADWDGLNTAIAATEAETVYVTHGYTAAFQRWLSEQGHDARILQAENPGGNDSGGAA